MKYSPALYRTKGRSWAVHKLLQALHCLDVVRVHTEPALGQYLDRALEATEIPHKTLHEHRRLLQLISCTVRVKCPAPPSSISSRSTLVSTT